MDKNSLEEKKYEEQEDIQEAKIEETNDETIVENNYNHYGDDDFRSKIIKMFGIVLIALVIILVIGFIISLFSRKNYSYSEVEDIMKDAAVAYFKDNKNKLPKKDETVEINTDILISNKYMKKLNYYLKKDNCSGKVSVERKTTSTYDYVPFLSCDNSYTTTKLAEEIRKVDNVVTEGFGVYNINGEYVYRGNVLNNYVKFSDSDNLWRIVKVTDNNEVVLISSKTVNNFAWDERYNNEFSDNSGLNLYKNSGISSIVNEIYNNSLNQNNSYYDDEYEFLTSKDKAKLVEFDACVGTRSKDDTTKDGSTECSVVEKTKISLLPVYDYLNASLDVNCTSTIKADCQNYNYLNASYSYWLANGDSKHSNRVYYVSSYINRKFASSESAVRLVVHLGENTMIEKGTGLKKDPFIIR